MIAAGFFNNGRLKTKKVSSKAKINLLYYKKNILEPFFEEEIPALYGNDIDKFELHMDKASSHTSKSTAACLAKKKNRNRNKIYILVYEIRVKSPYAFAMDFCAFGLLKRALSKRHPKPLNGLWKTVQEE
ncbi:uncharacterized protein TNCV_3031031 [Trichonephila clavipes]|nr:uncharacterized protein TNCV_3031031 [Trichonephila clavipes]